MIEQETYPLLFECCRVVKGSKRAIICDIQRSSYRVISNEIANLLINMSGKSINQIKESYNNKQDKEIDFLLKRLIDEDFVFFSTDPDMFPSLSLEWNNFAKITNSIVDLSLETSNFIKKILKGLHNLGCSHLQIRLFRIISMMEVERIVKMLNKLCVISVQFILPYKSNEDVYELNRLHEQYPRLRDSVVYAVPNNIAISPTEEVGFLTVTSDMIDGMKSCGKINESLFVLNMLSFTEANSYNSCLNRKISIDINGDIKNCPSMNKSFGNIRDTTLEEAFEESSFKEYWNINKNKIHVCKDCEFRYICTDCRAYIETPEDILSKPLKCGYNPYTSEWSEWSTNKLKRKAIKLYNMESLIVKEMN